MLLLSLVVPATSLARDPMFEEDTMKAAFVHKFAHFVTWPSDPEAGEEVEASILVCITGRESFEMALRETIARHQASDKNIEIRRVEPDDSTDSCQMLFIAASIASHSHVMIEQVGTRPILTIGESEGFAELGGMINFSVEGRKIRLQVNRSAAERSGLKVSSQVLKLAQLVRQEAE